MIKVLSYELEKFDGATNTSTIRASLVADTKAEVEELGNICVNVEGVKDDTILSFGSTALTVQGQELGILGSDDEWVF